MTWRYQPVWIRDQGEKLFVLIEVFFSKKGKLKSWTKYEPKRGYEPMGTTIEELREELELKLSDARRWEPVQYDKMQVGMEFRKLRDGDGKG